MQIYALLTRSQCKVSDTQVTVKVCGPLVYVNWLFKSYDFTCVCVYSVFLVLFVGNVDIWHGNIDILVKHTAITIGRRAEVLEPDDESDDEEIYPQPAHKTFKPDDSGQNYYEVEFKKQDSDLYRYVLNMQIISQTLTNAFAQRKHWCRLLVVQLMSL